MSIAIKKLNEHNKSLVYITSSYEASRFQVTTRVAGLNNSLIIDITITLLV
jgi:hypothetical protein